MTTIVTIDMGGTGATHAAGAREALSVPSITDMGQSYAQANAAYAKANAAYTHANSAYVAANNAQVTVYQNNAANVTTQKINFVNTSTITVSVSNSNGNADIALTAVGGAAYDQANAAYGQANQAYSQANNARSDSNTTFSTVNTTFGTLNTTFGSVNTTFGTVNTNYQAAYAQANTARGTANDAYAAANTKLSTSGGSISGDLSITGNLTVQGNATTINVTNLSVNDSMILLATGGTGDSTDIGFVGHIQNGATNTHVGLIRKATENRFYLFDNYEVEPTNNVIDVTGNNFRVGNLRLNTINANSFVTSAGLDVTGQANAAYGQANAAYTRANTKLDSSGGTVTGNLTVTGTLTVSGNVSSINTQSISSVSNEIILNSNASGSPTLDGKLTINRGSSSNVTLLWNETADKWGWTDNGTTYYYFDDIRAGYAQANAAYAAANNRVLKAGDTMTGALAIQADASNEQLTIKRATNTNEQLILGFNSSDYGSIQAIEQNVAYRPLILNRDGGNVSIGTSSSLNKLHVLGSSYSSVSTGNGNFRLEGSGGNGLVFGTIDANSSYASWIQSGYVVDFNTARYNLLLQPIGGNVAIGTTSASALLTVGGDQGGTANSALAGYSKTMVIGANNYNVGYNSGNAVMLMINSYSNDASDNVYPIYVEDENNVVDFYLYSGTDQSANTKRAYFGGRVGIGTSTPNATVQIYSSNTVPALLRLETPGNSLNTAFWMEDYDTNVAAKAVATMDLSAGLGLFNLYAGAYTASGGNHYGSTRGASRIGMHDNAINFYTANASGAGHSTGTVVTWYQTLQSSNANFIVYTNNGTERVRVDANGNVSIGTTSTAHKLEVSGGNISYKPSVGNNLRIGDDESYLTSGTGRYTTVGFSGMTNGSNRIFAHNTGEDGIFICSATNRAVVIRAGGSATDHSVFTSAGNFYTNGYITNIRGNGSVSAPSTSDHSLGTRITLYDATATAWYAIGIESDTMWFNADTQYKWYVDAVQKMILDSSGNLTASGNITAQSDERKKKNIKTIENPLNKVLGLRGVSFTKVDDDSNNIGVIAQEVEKILPEVVMDGQDGFKSVAYGNIVGLLIEAIKEQQKQIEELKAKVGL